jgi:hypothetical protein
MAKPRPLADSNRAAERDPLFDNGQLQIFVRMIVIQDQHLLRDIHKWLQMHLVLGRYDAAVADLATVVDHDSGRAGGVVGGDVQPRIRANGDRVA